MARMAELDPSYLDAKRRVGQMLLGAALAGIYNDGMDGKPLEAYALELPKLTRFFEFNRDDVSRALQELCVEPGHAEEAPAALGGNQKSVPLSRTCKDASTGDNYREVFERMLKQPYVRRHGRGYVVPVSELPRAKADIKRIMSELK